MSNDELLAAARALLEAPDLNVSHAQICAYVRDHGGLVFAYSPPGNTKNLIQFEYQGDGYIFCTPDKENRNQPSDPVFEQLFADQRHAEVKAAFLRQQFETLLPKNPKAMAALLVALAER